MKGNIPIEAVKEETKWLIKDKTGFIAVLTEEEFEKFERTVDWE